MTDQKPEESMEVTAPENETEEQLPPELVPIKDLVIMPPRQKSRAATEGLKLPVLRAEEPVMSLRGALSDILGFAHMTCYRFELGETVANIQDWKPATKSPYTGTEAIISIPAAYRSLNHEPESNESHFEGPPVLDEFGNLVPLLDSGLKDMSSFHVVLERYDGAAVKDHVARLKFLFDGNVPSTVSLIATKNKKEDDDKSASKDKPMVQLSKDAAPIQSDRLQNFFYLTNGEDPKLYLNVETTPAVAAEAKKQRKKKNGQNGSSNTVSIGEAEQVITRDKIGLLNKLIAATVVQCTIRYSAFHPPPPGRKLMGDMAYILAVLPDNSTIHVTAVSSGFYVNKSKTSVTESPSFDPAPAAKPCFSHSLLDCLLEASPSLYTAWGEAIDAAARKSEIEEELGLQGTKALFFDAIRGDFPDYQFSPSEDLERKVTKPSWLTPAPKLEKHTESWNSHSSHKYSETRLDGDLANSFGVDLRNGAVRDWNEEVQMAREMPTTALIERLDRARALYKVMTEFGEAALLGVKAIANGQLAAMNPMEPARCQVFLHNNIFVSQAVDAGPETIKIARGDRAAKKSHNRECQCNSTFHRMETKDFYTSAFVLIDYLGTRYVCQSVLPGILSGEKAHSVLCGSIESESPLKWDADFHKKVEDTIGEGLMIATRPIPRECFTDERIEAIKSLRTQPIAFGMPEESGSDENEPSPIVHSCMPIEAKAITGSDKRTYVLDFVRLTPRDANWLPEAEGGTGNWEQVKQKQNGKSSPVIPSHLDDEEWSMCLLRPELVTRFTQISMAKYIREKRESESEEKKTIEQKDNGNEGKVGTAEAEKNKPSEDHEKGARSEAQKSSDEKKLSAEDLKHLNTLRLNLNVFIKDLRPLEGVDEEGVQLLKEDEQRVRDASNFLWEEVLPGINTTVRRGALPIDGTSLTELLHRHGVNCRYMGRLAALAIEEEVKDEQTEKDLKEGRPTMLERRTMPKAWLEMLECEMLARAARHVLDSYLTENSGAASMQPAQTVASFLSALVSSCEETAGQTETRLDKLSPEEPDEEDFNKLTIFNQSMDGECTPAPIRSRHEVWQDLEVEIGRRFRYSLTLYNQNGNGDRARYIPLLRRVCQRTGIRLVAKNYDVGSRGLCSGGNSIGGGLTASYPISPLDIVDIVPLMKHAAAYNEGFAPCSTGPTVSMPPLQVSFADARITLEKAHVQYGAKALGSALELAQESANLYQKVTENHLHPSFIDCIELMGQILLEAKDVPYAIDNTMKALALTVQVSGFDSPSAFSAHMLLFQLLVDTGNSSLGIKHLRAAIYLLEVMAGPNHPELFNAYHRWGSIYNHKDLKGAYYGVARRMFEEAAQRDGCDRLTKGINDKALARSLNELKDYKEASAAEKRAFLIFSTFLGPDHQFAKDSDTDLQKYTKLAVESGKNSIVASELEEMTAIAEAYAADLVAEEEKKAAKSKKKKKKSKK